MTLVYLTVKYLILNFIIQGGIRDTKSFSLYPDAYIDGASLS
jgi:hypothetical protein